MILADLIIGFKFTMQSTISGDKVIYKTFFQWLKQPNYKMEDDMAIGISNKLTISRDHTMLVYSRLENYGGGTEWYPLEDTYRAPYIDAGGHSIKFKLVKRFSTYVLDFFHPFQMYMRSLLRNHPFQLCRIRFMSAT